MMPRDSLKTLLKMFPYFLDKSSVSNFYKSQDVTNRRFQKAYNELFKIYESFHLKKRVLVWKEQTENYDYVINFVANVPHLKRVTIYKNNTLVYTESFNYEGNIDSFDYSYSDSTLNDVSDVNLADKIPQHNFRIEVETYDEYTLTKGWPENDTIQGNEYDHDISLDKIGALHNIPRKTYLTGIPENMYEYTEPAFNDRGTEDDYHYMNRMLEYMVKLHSVHPVVLEIWKLYGIEATMLNRERLLIKMFDEEYHQGVDWAPQEWEHKDRFCNYTTDSGVYFFTSASTKTPLKNKPVTLYFQLLDSFAQTIDEDYLVDVYLNNSLLVSDYGNKSYKLTNIPPDIENTCRIECKNSTGVVDSDELIISVRGCNNADLYVAENGNNHNPGTKNQPLKTVQKAINNTQNDTSVIVMQSGNYDISAYDPVVVKNSCSILGCGSVLMGNTDDYSFFKIPKGKSVSLNDITLQYKGSIYDVDEVIVRNNNHDNSPVELLIYDTGAEAVELTRISMTVNDTVYLGSSVTVTGVLKDKYNHGVAGKTVRVTCPGSTPVNTITDSNGAFTATLEITRTGSLTVTSKFLGDNNYAPVRIIQDINSLISIEDAFNEYDLIVMDMEYRDNDWKYTYKSVSEIESLSDINGAIMNVQFTSDKNVIFNRFTSTSTEARITNTELESLTGMLMGIIYEEYKIKHTNYEVN